MQHSYNIVDRHRSSVSRRPQSIASWKRPKVWFRFVITAFSLNLIIAIVTVERHTHFSVTTTFTKSKSEFTDMMDLPRILPLSSQWKDKSKAEFSTESRIWHRMLLQQDQNKNSTTYQLLCGDAKEQPASSHAKSLPPFGFSETVRAYVREHENSKESPTTVYCHAPPSEPLCQSLKYTVVIYSSGHTGSSSANRYWRNIVVWAVKFLAYPSVERINLVLREEEILINTTLSLRRRQMSSLEDSASRNKYAKRVIHWSRKGFVNVVSAFSLWDAIDRLDVPSESVLWINGDSPVDSQSHVVNETVLNHRFRAWREMPNAFAIPQRTNPIPTSLSTIENQSSKLSNDRSICSYPLLHGIMMHTNYLCYLDHPVVGTEIRSFTKSLKRASDTKNITENTYGAKNDSWDTVTMAIGMLLFSIGDGYVISNAESSSAATNLSHGSRNTLPFAAGSNGILATYKEDISNYFGCPCSTAVLPLSPSKTWHCSSD